MSPLVSKPVQYRVVFAPEQIATTLLAAAGLHAPQAECTSQTSMAAPPTVCMSTRRSPAGLTPSRFTVGLGQRTKIGRFLEWSRMKTASYKEKGFLYAVRN
jgi:hypothetical protein